MWWIVGLLVLILLELLSVRHALEPLREFFQDRLDAQVEKRADADDAESNYWKREVELVDEVSRDHTRRAEQTRSDKVVQ
jgi:hypothetical protein